jgi:23S rRNA (adenine2503-C2)-methyltransferase
MTHKHGNSLCISTQAGCRMGCRFCASAIGGLIRNLTAGEMLSQVYGIQKATGKRVDNIVLMGCGEPLDNYNNVIRFLKLAGHPKGLRIGLRHITVSTCGLVPQINRLAKEKLPVTLAVSLHAPNDTLRRQIMPVAKKYTLEETLTACADYASATNRRITYEYALIQDFNDSDDLARELTGLLKNHLCHVNLIPVNTVSNDFKPSKRANAFMKILKKQGIPATQRVSLGSDIEAACGQLRSKHL